MDIRSDGRSVLSFAKLKPVMPMPNLLDVQLRSFEKLVETEVPLEEQWDFGLDRVFGEIFPISDVNENFTLEYVSSALGEPKYSVEECIERDMTYAAPLKATLRLIVWEDLEDGERRPGDIIEKEVYLGDLPLLTELGTFIINGAERVVVSQLHRSPGVIFEENIHPNGTKLHSARIIPFRGSWVEFTIDINNICYVHIDKKKKFPATALLRAFGYGTDAEVYQLFFDVLDVDLSKRGQGGPAGLHGCCPGRRRGGPGDWGDPSGRRRPSWTRMPWRFWSGRRSRRSRSTAERGVQSDSG